MPCMKLLSKERHGAKVKRRHDKPQTPCDRLLQSEDVSEEAKKDLLAQRAALNPFVLTKRLEEKLSDLFALQKTYLKQKEDLQAVGD